MKKLITMLCALLFMLSFLVLPAQEMVRFIDDVFDGVLVTNDLEYGQNMTMLTLAVDPVFAPTVDTLRFDFYQPEGDDAENRPLVIILPGGNFLPAGVNATPIGSRKDLANVEIARRLARKGYAAANISYRVGWNPQAPSQPARAQSIIQAAYRGLQDARTAIRFFREDSKTDNLYRIDTSRIVLWGISTGGYVSLVAATLDDYEKIEMTTQPPGKFLTQNPGPGPELISMIQRAYIGDIYGGSYPEAKDTIVVSEDMAFPPLEVGDKLNIPNHLDNSSDFHLAVNMGGALADLSWLEEGHVPIINFHVPSDPSAPYESEVLGVPPANDPVIEVQGSKLIAQRSNELGNNAPLEGWEEIEEIARDSFLTETQNAKDASAQANGPSGPHDYYEGLYPFIRPPGEGEPWQWWDTEYWSGVPSPIPGFESIHELALIGNPTMSEEQGMEYVDKTMNYFLPRAYQALDLRLWTTPVIHVHSAEMVGLSASPNPANKLIRIGTDPEYPLLGLNLFDMNGRLLQSFTNLNLSVFELSRGNLPPGTYLVQAIIKDGVSSKLIMFQ